MAPPHKGVRVPISLRLPAPFVERIKQLGAACRHDWIIDAIEHKLNQEETENGRPAKAETG